MVQFLRIVISSKCFFLPDYVPGLILKMLRFTKLGSLKFDFLHDKMVMVVFVLGFKVLIDGILGQSAIWDSSYKFSLENQK